MTSNALLRSLRRKVFFRGAPGNFYSGVFSTFEDALKTLPADQTDGYDSELAAGFYRERLDRVFSEDYPVMYWLRPLMREGMRVVDFGGHVGLHFYGYRTRMEFPSSLSWVVADVAAVRTAGIALARERGVDRQVSFVEGLASCDGADVLLSSGALQYLEANALSQALAAAARPPSDLLLNNLPVRDGPAVYTVQDTGAFLAPYTVFSREQLCSELKAAGYQLVDSWSNPEYRCRIDGNQEKSVKAFSGFYFRRVGPPR